MKHKRQAIVFGSYIFSLINFRKNLLEDLVRNGYTVLAIAPGYDEEVVRKLKEMQVEFRSVELARTGFNPLKDFSTILELKKIFKVYQPDLLITYTIKPVIYGTLAASFSGKTKTLALITGLGYLDTGVRTLKKKIMQSLIHALYRFSLRKLNFIAFQNPDDQEYFLLHKLVNPATAMTITAGSGVDLAYYTRAEVVREPVIFLLTARLIRAKGIDQYLEAASNLKKQFGNRVIFQLIGLLDEGNPDSIDQSQLNKLVEEGVIDYKGFQKDVRSLLRTCSVFVLPSYYREGTPRTILEAMAMGKAIITTDNPGCRETVRDGSNGFLIPVKNAEALQSAMRKFIERSELIEEMGEASYQLAKSKYDVHLVNHHLFEFASL
ncbi:MAG TPA: glycosyltransferase family 4 protein [Ohtaekwangia sp.]|uniref:glycosyltransferase family 4 protein n=1 Tax=Ohtaekwangia sp. TaxID=2066019 RepID=UPI002F93F8DA